MSREWRRLLRDLSESVVVLTACVLDGEWDRVALTTDAMRRLLDRVDSLTK